MQLIVSNPPKKKARKARKAPVMAKKKKRAASGGGFKKFRRSSRRGFASLASSFSVGKAVALGATAGASAIGINMLVEKFAGGTGQLATTFNTPTKRGLLKAGLGIGLGLLARKVGLGKHAMAIAAGGVAMGAVDIYVANRGAAGLGGVDFWNTGEGIQGLGDIPTLTDAMPVTYDYAAYQQSATG